MSTIKAHQVYSYNNKAMYKGEAGECVPVRITTAHHVQACIEVDTLMHGMRMVKHYPTSTKG